MGTRMTDLSKSNVERADNFLIHPTDQGDGYMVVTMLGESTAYIHGKFAPVVYKTADLAYKAIRRINKTSEITLKETLD